jgi:hypothetical protein
VRQASARVGGAQMQGTEQAELVERIDRWVRWLIMLRASVVAERAAEYPAAYPHAERGHPQRRAR